MMKLFFLLFLIPVVTFPGGIDCKQMQQGIFKLHGLYGSLNTVVRTQEKQTEIWGQSGLVLEYDICWTSDCTYWLSNRKVLKGKDSLIKGNPSDTLYCEISPENEYWHKVTSIDTSGQTKDASYFHVDTSTVYRDLGDLEKLKEYTGKQGGGSFVGYNYAVSYKQHAADTSQYIIAFLEALMVHDRSKFKLLDYVCWTVDSNQRIATSNCRFNDKFDKEVIAVYSSGDAGKEATIVKAWRFNKRRLKIEEVNCEEVKFKEADRAVPLWD
jgi:hypothetical protein